MTPDAERPTRGLNWAYALIGIADGTLLPFIPLYLLQRGLDAVQIGAVLAATAAVSLVAGLAWSYLSDRKLPPEHLLVLASGAACAVALTVAVAGGATEVAIAIIALSLVRAPFMLLDPITLRRMLHANRTDYARIRLRSSAGWTVSAVASGTLFQTAGLRLMPLVYAPLVAVFGLWVRHAIKPDGATPVAAAALRVRQVPWSLLGFLAACFLLGVSLAATQNFLTLRINGLGGGALLIGAAAACQALTEIPTMAYTHVLRRHLSNKALFAVGCGVYLALFIAWGLVSDATTAALLKLAGGVAFALTFVAAVMITDELTPAHMRATGQALVKAVLFGLAPIAGAFGGGVVYGAFGSRAMFLISTAVVAAAAVIAMRSVPGPRFSFGRRSVALEVRPSRAES